MRSLKLRAYLNYLQTPVSVYLPQQKPQSPTPGGTHKIFVCLVRHTKKNICLLVALPLWRDLFETISVDRTTKSPKHLTVLPNSQYRQTSTKNWPGSTSAQNIDSPNFTNIETCPKRLNYRYAQSLDKPPMCGIPDLGVKF